MNRKIVLLTLLLSAGTGLFWVRAARLPAAEDDEVFGIYTARLDGKERKPLITSSWQQMTHARLSPDKEWITLTRYTNRGKDGYATENESKYEKKGQQYLGTEVLVMRSDGTDVRALVPAQKNKIAANSYWTPDGKGIIYVAAPNEKGRPQISHIILDEDMRVKETTKIPMPDHIVPTDPHWVGDWVAFPAMDVKNKRMGIWRIRPDGTGLELLARTPRGAIQDNDPKLSPDGSQAAFMRRVKPGLFFEIFIVDTRTKELRHLSKGFLPEEATVAIEAVPSWSSDGKLLIFDRIIVDREGYVNEVHTMLPDGSGRKRVPLPEGYVYFHPSFFPGEGSGPDAHIIVSTHKVPLLAKRTKVAQAVAASGYERMYIIDEVNTNGIFDPSVEYNEDGSVGWMVYSSIDAPKYIRTHLAKSLDHGKTWTFVKMINPSVDGRVRRDGEMIDGSWWSEVATLVHDPDDPGREWKLYWHKYFATHIPNAGARNRVLRYSWIAYKYAADPAGEWSKEIPLFGAGMLPLKPYKARIDANALHPDLQGRITYTEPGSLYKDGVLYLTLQGHKFVDQQNNAKIILVASHDHGKTWEYIDTLLENKDAVKFGATYFSASSMVEAGGRVFLFAGPQDPAVQIADGRTEGIVVFEFEDIRKGRLKRDAQGGLVVVKRVKPVAYLTGGQGDHDEHNTRGGIIIPQLNVAGYPNVFQIYNTRKRIID